MALHGGERDAMGYMGPSYYQGDDTAPAGCIYHYTSRTALPAILKSGVLKPKRTFPDDVAPLVWCSSNAIWEPACGRSVRPDGIALGFDAQEQVMGHARIAIDAAVIELGWKELRRLISPSFLRFATQSGSNWYQAHRHRWHA